MAGTIRGRVDAHVSNINEHQDASEHFKLYFDALEAHPGTTRVAMYYGDGGATGMGYQDEANPHGNDAFAVWRFEPNGGRSWAFYVCLYTNSSTNGKTSTAFKREGGSVSSTAGTVLISAAVGIGGNGNPWNGTTLNDGTDTVGTPRWATPSAGTGLIVAPATNRDGSEDGTNKDNAITLFQVTSWQPGHTASIIMDDDSLIIVWDLSRVQRNLRTLFIGEYLPFSHLTVSYPFAAVKWHESAVTGNRSDEHSSVADTNDETKRVWVTWDTDRAPSNPEEQAGVGAILPQRVALVLQADPTGKGVVGTLPDTILVARGKRFSMNAAKTQVMWGRSTYGDAFLIPWGGAAAPYTNNTREGVTI